MHKRAFTIGVLSDKGAVKERNQDGILVMIGEDESGEFGLFAVADGMGGHTAGDVASSMAMSCLKTWWDVRLPAIISGSAGTGPADAIRCSLQEAVLKANEEIMVYGNRIGRKVGTTLSLIFIYDGRYWVQHIGDSRIYRIDKMPVQLTEDHSWVAGQVSQGFLSKAEARVHPRRNVLTQCLGMEARIDLFEASGALADRELFLLCSDGFYGKLENHEMPALSNGKRAGAFDLQGVAEALLEKVKRRGEADNISAILVEAGDSGSPVAALRRAFAFVCRKGYNRGEMG